MMTDLMYQHMLDDGAEGFVVLAPNSPGSDDDRARSCSASAPAHSLGAERQPDALEQAAKPTDREISHGGSLTGIIAGRLHSRLTKGRAAQEADSGQLANGHCDFSVALPARRQAI
jgi:hypothetical protein